MPLLITPTAPFQNDAHLDVASVYAIIEEVGYKTREKRITYSIAYYASDAARSAGAAALKINALPSDLAQAASPEQANAVPILQFLEQALYQHLSELLGEGATIDSVP